MDLFRRLAREATKKRAAVAYVTTDDFVKFGAGDVLVTDASDHAISSGQTDAKVLARAFKRGAELFSLPGLHAKVYLLGGVAVIGSASDLVIEVWSDLGEKQPTSVYRHTPIIHRQEEDTCTRFYVEDREARVDSSHTWDEFNELVHRVGLVGRIGPTSAREIPEAQANALFELWRA